MGNLRYLQPDTQAKHSFNRFLSGRLGWSKYWLLHSQRSWRKGTALHTVGNVKLSRSSSLDRNKVAKNWGPTFLGDLTPAIRYVHKARATYAPLFYNGDRPLAEI